MRTARPLGAASATCSNRTPPSSRSRSTRQRRHKLKPHVHAMQVDFWCKGTRMCTRLSPPVLRMRRAGRPATHACGATACIGRSTPPHGGAAAPAVVASPSTGRPTTRSFCYSRGALAPTTPLGNLPPVVNPRDARVRGGEGGRGTEAKLEGVPTTVDDMWAADFAAQPRVLAL